jgi:hypothetical protein
VNTTTLSIVAGPVTARNYKEICALATASAEEKNLENYFTPDKGGEYEEFCCIYDHECFREEFQGGE